MKKYLSWLALMMVPVIVFSADLRIQYNERMIGANHPTLTDTLNRMTVVEHNTDGTHKDNNVYTDLITKGPWVDVRAFAPTGTLADGTVDWITYIQAAVDYITAKSSGDNDVGTLLIPPGRYKISNTIQIYNSATGTGSYCSIKIVSTTNPYATAVHSTTIEPTFVDKPAIAITRGAGVSVEGLSIVGKNDFESSIQLNTYATYHDPTAFVVNGARDTVFSPYAGIVIDPYRNGLPPDGGYPGLSSWYTATNGSTRITIKNCFIYGFVVGLALSPNGVSQNGEDIHIEGTMFRSCKYGVSVGQSQNRRVDMKNCTLQGFYWGIVTGFHGQKIGSFPYVDGLLATQGKYLIHVTETYGSGYLNNVFAEEVVGIGLINGGLGLDSPLQISNSQLYLSLFTYGSVGSTYDTTYMFHNDAGWVKFTSVAMYTRDRSLRFTGGGKYHFDTCTFRDFGGTPTGVIPVWFENQRFVTLTNSMASDAGSALGRWSSSVGANDWSTFWRMSVFPGTNLTVMDQGQGYPYYKRTNSIWPMRSLGSLSVNVDNSVGTATFTHTDASKYIRVGDIIWPYEQLVLTEDIPSWAAGGMYHFPMLGQVKSVNGDNVVVGNVPHIITSGTKSLYMSWYPLVHAASTGYMYTNTTIDNVTNPTSWSIGNRIQGANIPAGAWIDNIVGDVFTISAPTTATTGPVRLYDADVYIFSGTAE
jgi:hypothetical protein